MTAVGFVAMPIFAHAAQFPVRRGAVDAFISLRIIKRRLSIAILRFHISACFEKDWYHFIVFVVPRCEHQRSRACFRPCIHISARREQLEDGLLAIFREGGPCLHEANEPRVLRASGDSIGDTLAITARNRLC